MPTLSELGERFLIKHLLKTVNWPDENLLPHGDDASAFWFNGLLVTSVDMLVWETDVPPGMTFRQAGWKAVVSAVSDIASKGARPKYVQLSLGLPSTTEFEDFTQLVEGAESAAKHYGARIAGGDINEQHCASASVSVIGSAKKLMSRVGASPGDFVAVTGLFGKTFAGLHALLNNRPVSTEILEAVLMPLARVNEGVALAESGGVSSCMDSSDGLAESLYILSEANGVGFVIENLPLEPVAKQYCEQNGLNTFDAVFFGGEEYELVFTIKPGFFEAVNRAVADAGGTLFKLGRVVAEEKIVYSSGSITREIEKKGWQHFKKSQGI